MQDKRPYNKQGQRHGRWVEYFDKTRIDVIQHYIDGELCGYREDHWPYHIKREYYAR